METFVQSLTDFNAAVDKATEAFREQMLTVNREAAAAVDNLPPLPSWVPTVEPVTPDVNVGEMVEQAFDAQARQLEANKKFAQALYAAWTPKTTTRRTANKSSK